MSGKRGGDRYGSLTDDANDASGAGADIGVRRQDVRQAGLQQHVIEGESFANFGTDCHGQLRSAAGSRA